MQNYTLIAPYTLQVTYDKQNSQKKEVYQYNKDRIAISLKNISMVIRTS